MPRTDKQVKTVVRAIQPNGTYDTKYGPMNRYELTVEMDGQVYSGEIGHKNPPKYKVGDDLWIEMEDSPHGLQFRNAFLETLPPAQPAQNYQPAPSGQPETKVNGFGDTDYMIAKQVAVKEAVQLVNMGVVKKTSFFQVAHLIHTYLLERDFDKFEQDSNTIISALFNG